MSELKAIDAYRLTTNTEDSDVYIHNDEFGCGGDLVECYLKSEADKVIAKKDAEIVELKKQVHDYAQGLYVMQARAEKKVRHHKYKRCLDKVKMCKIVMDAIDRNIYRGFLHPKFQRTKSHLAKWLELAEKFKLNNSTAEEAKETIHV